MKKNVDLTRRRDFYKGETQIERLIQNYINKTLKTFKKYPWYQLNFNHINSEDDLEYYGNKNILVMGNKAQRNSQKVTELTDCVVCECCGKIFKRYPWSKYYELCEECNSIVSENYIEGICWQSVLKTHIDKQICWR